MTEWQPIDTAPKGSPILGFIPDDYITVVRWDLFAKGWVVSDDCCGADVAVPVSHWQPLPPPPEGE